MLAQSETPSSRTVPHGRLPGWSSLPPRTAAAGSGTAGSGGRAEATAATAAESYTPHGTHTCTHKGAYACMGLVGAGVFRLWRTEGSPAGHLYRRSELRSRARTDAGSGSGGSSHDGDRHFMLTNMIEMDGNC